MYQVPGTSYICSHLVCGFIQDHHRGGSEMTCLYHIVDLSHTHQVGYRLCRCQLVSLITPTNTNFDFTKKKAKTR